METHALHPAQVLQAVRAMGGRVRHMLLVAVEPAPLDPDDMCMDFSPAVQACLDEAVGLVESLLTRVLNNDPQLWAAPPHIAAVEQVEKEASI